jgi:5-formyltetrahydrofolate cyclo-ligase
MAASPILEKNMEEKKEIRKKIFKARKEHTDAWIRENSLRITEALTQLPEYRNAERIMAYADYNHEVITRYIIEQAWKDGKEVAVPKVFGKDMVFYRLTDFSQLESGYFGIPEPKEDGETVSWEEAMMVMPGVAFDVNCNRVGYGGGFYDVWLKRHGSHVTACGLAYDFQLRNEIPFERHDRMMNIVITPDEVIRKGDAADDND